MGQQGGGNALLPLADVPPRVAEEAAVVTVALGDQAESLVRKRTVGILDMGGASLQIAYEVPGSGAFSSPQQVRTRPGDGAGSKPRAVADRRPLLPQEEAAKSLLAEFNLGCDVQHTGHVYRVYVNTFLGFGGNFARQRYEELVLNQTYARNRYRCRAWRRPCCKMGRRGLPSALSPLDLPQEPPAVITAPTATLAAAGCQQQVLGPHVAPERCPAPSPAGLSVPPPTAFPSSSRDSLSASSHRVPTSSSLLTSRFSLLPQAAGPAGGAECRDPLPGPLPARGAGGHGDEG